MADMIFGGVRAPLGSDLHAAVMSLAAAEVRRSTCIRHLIGTEEARIQPDPELDHITSLIEDVIQDLPPEEARRGRRRLMDLTRTSQRSKAEEYRLANRYLAEAEAQLSKARRRYAECLRSRNDPNFNYGCSSLAAGPRAEFPLEFPADGGLSVPDGFKSPDEELQERKVKGLRDKNDEEEHPPARQEDRHHSRNRPNPHGELGHQEDGEAVGAFNFTGDHGAIHRVAEEYEGDRDA